MAFLARSLALKPRAASVVMAPPEPPKRKSRVSFGDYAFKATTVMCSLNERTELFSASAKMKRVGTATGYSYTANIKERVEEVALQFSDAVTDTKLSLISPKPEAIKADGGVLIKWADKRGDQWVP